MTIRERKRGCLLGLAIGDALGAAVEFEPPGSFQPVTDYRAGGPHGHNPGEFSDDTSMAPTRPGPSAGSSPEPAVVKAEFRRNGSTVW